MNKGFADNTHLSILQVDTSPLTITEASSHLENPVQPLLSIKPTRNQLAYSSFSKLLCTDHYRGNSLGVDSFTPSKHVFSLLLLMSSDLVTIEGTRYLDFFTMRVSKI